MAQLGTYCFDGDTFAQAYALYTDNALTNLAPDGFYAQGQIVRQQLNGILLNAQPCSACLVPCGEGIAASISNQNGLFTVDIDVANSTGAVVLYFFMGTTIPDGVDIIWNSTHYNRLTCAGNNGSTLIDGAGNNVDYAGINNQGTGLPTYVGNSNNSLLADSPYNTAATCPTAGGAPENYTYISGNYVAQGTTTNVTVVSDQIGYAATGSPVFTAVIPKGSATPTTLRLDIYAPMCGTAFRYEIDCPITLPTFTASPAQLDIGCSNATVDYYFARNATGTALPFTQDTNERPVVGNFVFTTGDGSTYLNDTNAIAYYNMDNNQVIGVRNGVVISIQACDPT